MLKLRIGTLAAILLAVTPLLAQETRGSLVGRVTDPTGAVVPGVKLDVVHKQTGVATKTISNQEGLYQLLYLVQGIYNLTASSPGFKTLAREGIEVRINDRLELNLHMELGAAAERVEVVGETPLLQTTTASMGQVVDHRRIAELPLLHGNPMAVLELTPGLAQARTSNLGLWGGRVFDNGWTTSFQIDGSGSNKHEVTLDGAANTTSLGGAGGGISLSKLFAEAFGLLWLQGGQREARHAQPVMLAFPVGDRILHNHGGCFGIGRLHGFARQNAGCGGAHDEKAGQRDDCDCSGQTVLRSGR